MITFHLYGFILGTAAVVGWWQAEKLVLQNHLSLKEFNRAGIFALVGGLIGARAYHVVDLWGYYSVHPSLIVAVWNGGLGIWGGLIGGMCGLWLSVPIKQRVVVADVIGLVLPLSQAIGRWGNFVNQELYGKATTLPWGIYISSERGYFHPLFLYESGLCLLLFFWLQHLRKWCLLGEGRLLGGYLIGYGSIRFGLEFLRIDPWRLGGMATAQWMSLLAIGIGIWLFKRVKYKPYV